MAKSILVRTSPWLLLALTIAACQSPLTGLPAGTGRPGSQQTASLALQARQTGGLKVAVRWPDRRIQDIAYRTEAIEVMVWSEDSAGNRKPALQAANSVVPVAIATDSEPVGNVQPPGSSSDASSSEPSPEFIPVDPIVLYRDSRGEASFQGLLGGENYVVTAIARDAGGKEIGHAEATCDIIPGTGNRVGLDMKASNPPRIDGNGAWPQLPIGPGATFSVALRGYEKDLPVEASLDLDFDDAPAPVPSAGVLTRDVGPYPEYGYGKGSIHLDSRLIPGDRKGSLELEVTLPQGLPSFAFDSWFGRLPRFNFVVRVDGVRSNPIPVKLDLSSFYKIYPTPYPSYQPSFEPSAQPSDFPTFDPSFQPSDGPSFDPSAQPSDFPPFDPSAPPSDAPTPGPTPAAVVDNLEAFPPGVSVYDVGELMCNATGSFMTDSALIGWGILSIRTPPNPSYGDGPGNVTTGHRPAFYGRDFGDLCAIGTTPNGQLPGPGTGYGAAHIQLHFIQPRAAVAIDFIGGPRPYRLRAFDASGSFLAEDTLVIPEGSNPRMLHRLFVQADAVPIQRVIIGSDANAGVLIRRIAHMGLTVNP